MRRRIERIALIVPVWLNLTLLAAVISLLLASFTDGWLPSHFIGWFRHFYAGPDVAGSGEFCLFMLAMMFLYVLWLCASGLIIAVALWITVIKIWRLAGR